MNVLSEFIQEYFPIRDNEGNYFHVKFSKEKQTHTIFLKLKSESRDRRIGELVVWEGKIYFTKTESINDLFRKTDAWSIPDRLMKIIDFFVVYCHDDKTKYCVDRETALKQGTYFNFKNTSGIEKKIYISRQNFLTKPL